NRFDCAIGGSVSTRISRGPASRRASPTRPRIWVRAPIRRHDETRRLQRGIARGTRDGYREAMKQQPVLVVDDDRHVRDALRALLETMGFRVAVAVNGADALERLRHETLPCLVVLDLEMPVL